MYLVLIKWYLKKKVHRALNLILSGENSELLNDYLVNF